MPNRSRESITSQILELCLSPVKKTAIMYGASLSYAQLQMYLRLLQESELIGKIDEDGKDFWLITSKGREYLQAYEAVKKILA